MIWSSDLRFEVNRSWFGDFTIVDFEAFWRTSGSKIGLYLAWNLGLKTIGVCSPYHKELGSQISCNSELKRRSYEFGFFILFIVFLVRFIDCWGRIWKKVVFDLEKGRKEKWKSVSTSWKDEKGQEGTTKVQKRMQKSSWRGANAEPNAGRICPYAEGILAPHMKHLSALKCGPKTPWNAAA